VRGFSAFNQSMMWAGAAESVANIASTGEVTFGDAIGLLGPLAHALGQRTGKMLSNGGCFVAGTPVALAALQQGWQGASGDPWAETTWLESFLAEEREFSAPLAMPAPEPAALAVAAELAAAVRVAIEQVPLGARVQTRNPRRWEYDDSLPEPDEATWAKLSLTVQRSDGGLVDAELLRPWAWIELHGLRAGELLPLHLAELEVSGPALVTAIEACPPIASGAGSVVTARFVTREVHRLVSVDLLGAGGELETLTGTPVHPVWSLDRGDWVPLAELTEGETLQGHTGPALVLHLSLHQAAQPVYNLEIHGEHVYQVGELGVLVHNAAEECKLLRNAPRSGLIARIQSKLDLYPQVIDPRTGRNIPFPSGISGRVDKGVRLPTLTRQEKATFIAEWHQRGFKRPVGGWKKYDIHHIQPREFGGTHDFWNLVPVERKTHQSLFNKWWREFEEL